MRTVRLDSVGNFKIGRIAVRVGQKHLRQFLKMCEKKGLLWLNWQKAMDFIPENKFGDDLAIGIVYVPGGMMAYGRAEDFASEGVQVIDFEETEVKTLPRYRIVIEGDGTTTTARMEIDGREVKTAQAKRNPNDKPNWRVGAETAFRRLWDTWREQRHKRMTLRYEQILPTHRQLQEEVKHDEGIL